MMRWLNYHHLLYFRVIATEGSIAKASEKLLIGQPALSSQLKNLEESLGYQLFERKNRSLILTEAGKVALEYADEIFKKGEEFIQIFNEKSLVSKSHYKIGVIDGIPKNIATKLIEESQAASDDNPLISVVEGDHNELFEKLNNHEIDIVLSNIQSTKDIMDIHSRSVGKSNVSVYGSEKFKKLTKKFPESLSDQPMILPDKHNALRYDLEHFFQEFKIQYDLIAEIQDSSLKKMMGEHGRGLICLPEYAAKQLVKEGKLFKIGRTNINEEYFLFSKKRTIKTPITDKLLKEFKI